MNQNSSKKNIPARTVEIPAEQAGRRLDNFLLGYFDNIPKTRVYRMLRKGEVRVNGGRNKPDYRLLEGDRVRLPPVFAESRTEAHPPPAYLLSLLDNTVIYEDDSLLVVNKPAGVAVHAGSGEKFGIIELLRSLRPEESLELVHRLDKATSGCLLLARDHRVLRHLHDQLRQSHTVKQYLALLKGRLNTAREVDAALVKNVRVAGERKVQLDTEGKAASSVFKPLQRNRRMTLARVTIKTGRTHQIRVHAAAIGHPVAGDDKYGDRAFNRELCRSGLKRMFLHAETLTIKHPETGKLCSFTAPLPEELAALLQQLMMAR